MHWASGDVPSVHDDAAFFTHAALLVYHGGTDFGHGGHFGYQSGDFGGADSVRYFGSVYEDAVYCVFGTEGDADFTGQFAGQFRSERFACLQEFPGYGPIHGAGVDVGKAEFPGRQFGDGAFACACRSVDSDYKSVIHN